MPEPNLTCFARVSINEILDEFFSEGMKKYTKMDKEFGLEWKKVNLDYFTRHKKYDKPCKKLKVNASYFVTRRRAVVYGREYVVKICVAYVHEASLSA